ncbi:MAG TPA: C-GCAxxG-C-C family protein [Thermoanaerobaculia bacterium]|nr:C-GCAxxG-C-C family protein [Thermoanaerobaculia bacterium]HUM30012.1 C-GCAxxG-C-C family protein [Thermoanaerobaculia bacterium]HXK68299.1 C-GCAxxG-C-C family protein [Thermoanaerobaculia bacterium]
MSREEQAVMRFNEGFSCAQAVFSVFTDPEEIDPAVVMKIASAFGGGMGRMGETCGAVTGALMALGIQGGPSIQEDIEAKEITYSRVQSLAERFRALHGTLECKNLLGCSLLTPEGREEADRRNLHETLCTKLVRDAVRIVEELLSES